MNSIILSFTARFLASNSTFPSFDTELPNLTTLTMSSSTTISGMSIFPMTDLTYSISDKLGGVLGSLRRTIPNEIETSSVQSGTEA